MPVRTRCFKTENKEIPELCSGVSKIREDEHFEWRTWQRNNGSRIRERIRVTQTKVLLRPIKNAVDITRHDVAQNPTHNSWDHTKH